MPCKAYPCADSDLTCFRRGRSSNPLKRIVCKPRLVRSIRGFFLPSGKLFYNLAFEVPFFDFHVQYIVMDNEDVVTGYQQYQNLFWHAIPGCVWY